jgi:hypothetical protein
MVFSSLFQRKLKERKQKTNCLKRKGEKERELKRAREKEEDVAEGKGH